MSVHLRRLDNEDQLKPGDFYFAATPHDGEVSVFKRLDHGYDRPLVDWDSEVQDPDDDSSDTRSRWDSFDMTTEFYLIHPDYIEGVLMMPVHMDKAQWHRAALRLIERETT